MKRALVVVAITACRDKAPDESLALTPYLGQVAVLDGDARREVIAGWMLDSAQWQRTVVPPYDARYSEYTKQFKPVAHRLDGMLWFAPTAIASRPHLADDPAATRSQQQARWALPVLAESYVATVSGVANEMVFLRVDGRWKAITGIDQIVRDAVGVDRECLGLIEGSSTKRCREIAWEIAEAALRNQPERFAHACTLAKTACGKPAP